MNKTIRWTLAGVLPTLGIALSLLTAGSVGAQDDAKKQDTLPARVQGAMQVTATSIRADRKALINRYMDLTAEEAEKFWPIYEAYLKDLSVPQERMIKLGVEFADAYPTVNDDNARKFLEDYLNAEKNVLDRKRTFVGRFEKALPPKKVLRLYQLENKMDAALEYGMMAEVPLVK